MLQFGSEKPDLRNPLIIHDVTPILAASGLRLFQSRTVRDIPVKGLAAQPRSFLDKLQEDAVARGAAGLAWITRDSDGHFKGPIAKQLSERQLQDLVESTKLLAGDGIVLMASTDVDLLCRVLGAIRIDLGKALALTSCRRAASRRSGRWIRSR